GMKIGIPKETLAGERRVALIPASIAPLKKLSVDALIESGAGTSAYFFDQDYQQAGATIVNDRPFLFEQSDIVAQVQRPDPAEAQQLREGAVFISFLQPMQSLDVLRTFASRKISA